MCQAMAEVGHEVTLISKHGPDVIEKDVSDDFLFYGVQRKFTIRKLARPSFRGGGILFIAAVAWFLWNNRKQVDLVYSRDIPGARIATLLGLPTIYEAHGVPRASSSQNQYQRIIRSQSFLRLVVISQGLQADLAASKLLPEESKVMIAHDGANPGRIDHQSRANGLSKTAPFSTGYVGQLYSGKGLEMIMPLAGRLAEVEFHIIGGQERDLRYWRELQPPPNVKFHGFISPGEVSSLYQQFDVLLLPPQNEVYGATGQSEISRWMSPLKMFEYMATGKPIISSDLPVLREVLTHEQNALLVGPDDIDGWETAVRRLQADPALAQKLGQQAQKDLLEEYTWDARAKKVLQGL
jgi:glycosyltransferase involved in cell wall biosynthesis